jgi:FkbM family methyltransferase
MNLRSWMIDSVQRQLGRRGLRITRSAFPNECPIDLIGILADRIGRTGRAFHLVQIGANDGTSCDPVHEHIVRRGWSALLVEPLPDAFARLCRTYAGMSNVRCVQGAIGPEDGTMRLYRIGSDNGDADGNGDSDCPCEYSMYASFSRDVLLKQFRHIPNLASRIVSVHVPAMTFSSLLRRNGVEHIDLLQVDAEGLDFEIIRMAFRTALRPNIISFESEHLSCEQKQDCARLLAAEGYRYLSRGFDTIAYRDVA